MFRGQIDTQSLLTATVAVTAGAFDAEGARAFVAALLGYEDGSLPAMLDYELSYDVQ